jgi:AraC-like DNA-binding protein
MTLKYFDTKNIEHLVEELFFLSFIKDDIPFQSTILPIGYTSITYIYNPGQTVVFKNSKTSMTDLIVTGQFQESYEFLVKGESYSYGVCFHPTALHKITQSNIFKLKNKHIPLEVFSLKLFELLNPIFIENKDNVSLLTERLKKTISEISIKTNNTISQIDNLIEIIKNKDGMLNTYELLDSVSFSQKTLETQFKKIVGITPGKYIRLYRFTKLMRKYEGKEISLKDLIYMYNYYDRSHFIKDFKYFMKQSPKDYFRTDHPLLNEYLNR